MPKFFCDYCDVYLTHDSMSVRKAHNSGRNHLRNVVDYYQQIGHEKAQAVIDGITSSYAAEGQSMPLQPQLSAGQGGGPPGFSGPPPPGMPGFGALPPGMPPLPPGFPMPPNGFPPGFNPPAGMPPFAGSPPANMPFSPPQGGFPQMPPQFPPQAGQAPGGGMAMSPPPGVRGPQASGSPANMQHEGR